MIGEKDVEVVDTSSSNSEADTREKTEYRTQGGYRWLYEDPLRDSRDNTFWLEEMKQWKPLSDEEKRKLLVSRGIPRKNWKYHGLEGGEDENNGD